MAAIEAFRSSICFIVFAIMALIWAGVMGTAGAAGAPLPFPVSSVSGLDFLIIGKIGHLWVMTTKPLKGRLAVA